MNVGTYIERYRRGAYTGKELVLKVTLLITREKLETVMRSIPEECLDDLATQALRVPEESDSLFNFHGSALEERETLDRLEAVRPLLKDWFSR